MLGAVDLRGKKISGTKMNTSVIRRVYARKSTLVRSSHPTSDVPLLNVCRVLKGLNANLTSGASIILCRHGHHLRGKAPGIAKSLQEKFAEENKKDVTIYFRVDIGLPPPQKSKSKQLKERLRKLKELKSNPELEVNARNQRLTINLEEATEDWLKSKGAYDIKQIADHFGVFQHLFGDAYFFPRVPLKIMYSKDSVEYPVYFGNLLKPQEASQKPQISFESDENTFWSLVMTNPDGHFTENDKEYLHWFVGNIPGNALEKGETIMENIQPFPPKGTGYHRHIFILYKQTKKLDFSTLKKSGKCLELSERTFSTYEFYKARQDDLTPAGLAFFQSDWSPCLKQFYNDVLDVKEPVFEYDFPPPYIRKQEWFPLKKPFNLYMDKYRDPKQINKEFLVRKLKDVHPFKPSPPRLLYPNAQPFEGYYPSWLKLEIRKSRLKWGRINDIE